MRRFVSLCVLDWTPCYCGRHSRLRGDPVASSSLCSPFFLLSLLLLGTHSPPSCCRTEWQFLGSSMHGGWWCIRHIIVGILPPRGTSRKVTSLCFRLCMLSGYRHISFVRRLCSDVCSSPQFSSVCRGERLLERQIQELYSRWRFLILKIESCS